MKVKFRTKLQGLFIILSLLTHLLIFVTLYHQLSRICLNHVALIAKAIAESTASSLNGDILKTIKHRDQETNHDYELIQQQLRKVRDANRNVDYYVKFIYTMFKSQDNTNVIVYGVDGLDPTAPDSITNISHVGDPVLIRKSNGEGAAVKIEETQVESDYISDQWGNWLSANVPVRDAKGSVVGAVGVDLRPEEIESKRREATLILAAVIISSFLTTLIFSFYAINRITRELRIVENGLDTLKRGKFERIEIPEESDFAEIIGAINRLASQIEIMTLLRIAMAGYQHKPIFEKILQDGKLPELASEERWVTVVFIDIRGFTKFSENQKPDRILKFLNDLLKESIKHVHNHKGVVDKYLGDGMMLVYGTVEEDKEQELHAVYTALALRNIFNELSKNEQFRNLRVGIGINCGFVSVGNLGCDEHMEFTVLGDVVNTASRLQTMTKELNQDIVLGESVYAALRGTPVEARCIDLGFHDIRGRKGNVRIYAIT